LFPVGSRRFRTACWIRADPTADHHHGDLLGHRPRHHRRGHRPARRITQDLLVRQLAFGIVLPGSFVHVLGGTDLLLAMTGLAIAVTGALGPAS
jgi:hypothetical protein